MNLGKAQIIIFSALTAGFLTIAEKSADPELDKLDPNVFKSLEKTKLKDLNDSFTNEDKVTMDYILTGNTIEEVFTPRGEFGLQKAHLLAHLPETNGTLTGKYDVTIKKRFNFMKPSVIRAKKSSLVRLHASGGYTAIIHDVDLMINISLPRGPGKKMGLKGCNADISTLNLTLTTEDEDEESLLANLKEKLLTGAMKKGFSELFCDTMERILNNGTDSPVVVALQNRLCKITGSDKCES